MLQTSDLDSPNEALYLLNSMTSSAEWNLFLQEGSISNLTQSQQDKELSLNTSFQCNSLTLGIPENNWNTSLGMSSLGYHSTTESIKTNELLLPITQESPLSIEKTEFNDLLQMSPRLNKDCRSYNCQYGSCSQECFSISSFNNASISLNDDLIRQQTYDDSRYELGKLDFGSDLTNMINLGLTESVDNEFLKVVDSDEDSDIIVEESDTESEISISDVGPYLEQDDGRAKLSCIVCSAVCKNATSSNFTQMNHSFPLTFTSKTPVVMKLIQMIPVEMHNVLKFEKSLICQRCINLIDAAESLELKLLNIKQELCNFISNNNPNHSTEPFSLEIPVLKTICNENTFEKCNQEADQLDQNLCEVKDMPKIDTTPKTFANKSTQNKQKSEEGKENQKGGNYQCDRCGRTYIKKSRLFIHLAKHSGLFKFKCQHCQRGFMKESNLQIHQRIHKTERKYLCQHCPASFTEENKFLSHVCREKRFMCDLCPKIFTSQEKLSNHCSSVHKERAKNICKICSKEFKHPSDLIRHMTSHDNTKKLSCSECGKAFKLISQLNQHIKIVHGKKHSCTFCACEFNSPRELREHNVNVHGRCEKFYTCEKCDKTFAEKRYLIAHEKTHLGTTKLNTCSICNKSFRYNLKSHMLTHAAEKPFKCDKCDIKFTLKSGLDKHNRAKHPDIKKQVIKK